MSSKAAPQLIAFYSPSPQMGKSTATQFLTKGLGYKPVKFAAPLKKVTASLLAEIGVPDDEIVDFIEGHRKEEPLSIYGFGHITSRKIQQVIGTEAGRDCLDKNLWASIAGRKVRQMLDQGERVVIDDMRFPNEYDLVKNLGGECWCIYNPRVEILLTEHQSEGSLSEHSFDVSLINEGSIEELQQSILHSMTRF